MIRCFAFLCIVLLGFSCTKDLTQRTEVYFNDFEGKDVDDIEISNAQGIIDPKQIITFNGNKVLGSFNTNYVQLSLNRLPWHNRLKIEFDLYIHDKWTGNQVLPGQSGPDLWILEVDGQYPLITTFSNMDGQFQSFPQAYAAGDNPFPARGNSWEVALPGICALANAPKGTTLYKVDMFHYHNAGTVRMAFTDRIATPQSLCEKSWSIDNVRITAMNFK